MASVHNQLSANSEAATTVTLPSYVVGEEANRVLVVVGTSYNGGVASLTCAHGASSLTLVRELYVTPVFNYRVAIFELIGASGTADLVLTSSTTPGFLSIHGVYLSGVAQQTAEAENDATDLVTPFLVSIGSGVTEGGIVVYGGLMHSGNFDISAVTESGNTALTDEFPGSGHAGAMGYEVAGPGGSASGGWTNNGTGGEIAGALVAASWAPAGGGPTVGAEADSSAPIVITEESPAVTIFARQMARRARRAIGDFRPARGLWLPEAYA